MATRKLAEVVNVATRATAKIYRNSELCEYCVRLVGHPNADYFTNDKDDAYATANAMVGVPNESYSPAPYNLERDIRNMEDARERDEADGADRWGDDPMGRWHGRNE